MDYIKVAEVEFLKYWAAYYLSQRERKGYQDSNMDAHILLGELGKALWIKQYLKYTLKTKIHKGLLPPGREEENFWQRSHYARL